MKKISYAIALIFFSLSLQARDITIVGCGYVGLTMAAIFTNGGHNVICVDIDKQRIERLNNYDLCIYEPHLKEMLFYAQEAGNLVFTNDLKDGIKSDIICVCVSTPTDEFGRCDDSCLYAVFNDLTRLLKDDDFSKIICVKSTVTPDVITGLNEWLSKNGKSNFHLICNPEFMREGSAIKDVYTSNPVVIGGESQKAINEIEALYTSILGDRPIIKTNLITASVIKCSWNSYSAIRIAYVNELASLCNKVGADIHAVIQGMVLSEDLLPTRQIKPGPGYGGACLPKDTVSFSTILSENGFGSSLVHKAIQSNKNHIQSVVRKILSSFVRFNRDCIVSILGLSFKANTDDIRNAPSVKIIQELIESGVTVKAYDPQAMENMKKLFPDIVYCDNPYDAVIDSDCLVVLTEWNEIKALDLSKVAALCRKKL